MRSMVELKGPKRQLPMERVREVVAGNDDEEGAGGVKPQKALLGAELRRGISVAKRGGTCTPVCAWKLVEDVQEAGTSWADDTADAAAEADLHGPRTRQHHRHRVSLAFPAAAWGGAVSTVSARELGANLWEIHDTPGYRMGGRSTRTRRPREEKLADLSDLSPLGHREVALTPSPLDLKGKSGYSCRTSTELLKVLNRIWSLEDQQSSTMSLVTKLKLELENAYTHIDELLHEKQSNHHEIDILTKKIVGDKLSRKSKEQEKIKVKVKSLEAELEDEKSLRRHSESLHRRLGKELSEIKAAFSKIMRDLEGEKKSHNLLADLCDEFAKGIREYEDEVRELKQKYEEGSKHRCNSLILDFSEAWLGERLQIKFLDSLGDLSEKKKMVDKLECEVEAFLRASRSCSISDDVLLQDIVKERCLHRQSLESIHLNGAGSAPQYAEDEDSVASDLHCFELKMGNATERHDSLKRSGILEKLEDARKSNVTKKMVGSSEKLKYHGSSSSWTKFDGYTQPCNDVKMQFMDEVQGIHRHNTSRRRRDANLNIDIVSHQKSEEVEGQEDALGMNDKQGSAHLVDHATDDAEFGKLHKQQPERNQQTEDLSNDSCELPHPSLGLGRDVASRNHHAASSLVQKWSYHHVSPDLQVSESSKLPQGIKQSTLKAKLLEARLEGQHGRLKTSRDSSVGA